MKIRIIDTPENIKKIQDVCEDFKKSALFELSYGEYPMRNSTNRRLYIESPDMPFFLERLVRMYNDERKETIEDFFINETD